MVMERHNHIHVSQANPQHREEGTQNTGSHMAEAKQWVLSS